jgi:hypothetical protein
MISINRYAPDKRCGNSQPRRHGVASASVVYRCSFVLLRSGPAHRCVGSAGANQDHGSGSSHESARVLLSPTFGARNPDRRCRRHHLVPIGRVLGDEGVRFCCSGLDHLARRPRSFLAQASRLASCHHPHLTLQLVPDPLTRRRPCCRRRARPFGWWKRYLIYRIAIRSSHGFRARPHDSEPRHHPAPPRRLHLILDRGFQIRRLLLRPRPLRPTFPSETRSIL